MKKLVHVKSLITLALCLMMCFTFFAPASTVQAKKRVVDNVFMYPTDPYSYPTCTGWVPCKKTFTSSKKASKTYVRETAWKVIDTAYLYKAATSRGKVFYSLFDNNFYVKLTRESSVTVEVKKDPVRNIERILTALRKMPGQKEVAEERLEGARQQLVQAREEVKKPFEKENELRSVQERLTKINAELDMKPKEEPKKMIKKEELKKCL